MDDAVIKEVFGWAMVHVKKQVSYMVSCRKHVTDMDNKMMTLDAKRGGVDEHINHNKRNHLYVPASTVDTWLVEVGVTKAKVDEFPRNVGSCFNIMGRHKTGRKAFKLIEEIERLLKTEPKWTDRRIPLGTVPSVNASSSTPSSNYNDFESRKSTFLEALKALKPDHKSHMIALWGMGGVGKTTMMEKMKKVVVEEKRFDLIVQAAIGEQPNPIDVQKAIADYLTINLTEKTKLARADMLRQSFKACSEEGKKKILVILDDVWQFFDMCDIGLSPSPDQGVDFKVLLTSRKKHTCAMMGVKDDCIFNLEGIEEAEAEKFFFQIVNISDDDHVLRKIGKDIVKKCCGLPIAIKTMALNLIGEGRDAWADAFNRLKRHKIDEVVHKVFEMSYTNLKDEEAKSVLLLCGLFLEDFDIPREDLVRYGWGLKLFDAVDNIKEARSRLNTCVDKLINTNLLIKSERVGCIKMHDLVRAFVLTIFSINEHASIINHGNMLEWDATEMREACKRLSLTCSGMHDFSRDFKYPNLSLLKLMHGDKSTRLPEDFFEGMEKLQVIAYENTFNPLLPRSLQCSTNLRTLCLHKCELMFDCSPLGVLLNLEVLSFANCGIRKLPSPIGSLNKLRLLDVTGCFGLRIDKGVLKGLVKLEELYMKVAWESVIYLTDDNWNELTDRSKNLSALEIEFVENNAPSKMKSMSFEKLERFKISMGCLLKDTGELENILMLASNKDEVLECRMNELFEKTNVLHLQVDRMNYLEDVVVRNSHSLEYSLLYNLRVLIVLKCIELRYLFTFRVVESLSKLERLEISSCDIMEELIHIEESGPQRVKFPKLKFLSLKGLPKLMSLSNTTNVVELPELMELELDGLENFTSIYASNKVATSCVSPAMQPLLKDGQVRIPKLEILKVRKMKSLKEIWWGEYSNSSGPMPLLHQLKELEVNGCDCMESLLKVECGDEIFEEGGGTISISSSLRSIKVWNSRRLRQVWRIESKSKGVGDIIIRGFEAVETISIHRCKGFRNVFTPTTANFHLKALTSLAIDCGWSDKDEKISDHVQVDWNNFFILQQPSISTFHNLTTIFMGSCHKITYLFSRLMARLLSNLKEIAIKDCVGIEEIVSNRDDDDVEEMTTHDILFPCLQYLRLKRLKRLRDIYGGCGSKSSNNSITTTSIIHHDFVPQHDQRDVALWSLHIIECNELSIVIPSHAARHMQNLKVLNISDCDSMTHIFTFRTLECLKQLKSLKISDCPSIQVIVKEDEDEDHTTKPSSNNKVVADFFPCLESLKLYDLPNLSGFFLGMSYDFQWPSLQEVAIADCPKMTRFNNIFTKYGKRSLQLESCGLNFHQEEHDQGDVAWWSLCQYPIEMQIYGCNELSSAIPFYATGHMQNIEVLSILNCESMTHIFTFGTIQSLKQLKSLKVEDCRNIQVIVKEEEDAYGDHNNNNTIVI